MRPLRPCPHSAFVHRFRLRAGMHQSRLKPQLNPKGSSTMNTTDKAALGRKFKHFVLAHVRQAPGWESYYLAKGWKGKTNALTRDEINQAAIDLGVDKRALWTTYKAEFGANAGAAESMQAQAIVAGEGDEAEGDARDAKVEQEAQAKGALNMAE